MSSTNFIGRDPMQWWIGQVTDPEKGKWKDCQEKQQADDGEDINAFRCRVRIVGYHGNDTDLPDEELPLAHVLLPPNTTTTGGCGGTMQYQGGEVVVGFFFDGEDGQQPVVFGTLFKQPFVTDQLTSNEFNTQKQIDFVPYTPPKVRQRAGKHRFYEKSPWPGGFSAGEAIKTIAQKQKEASTNITVVNPTACEDNEISKISNAIKDFTRKMETLQQLNEQSTYVDPIYGGIIDIQEELKFTSLKIHSSTTKLVRRARSWLIQDTLDKLNLTLKEKTPKTLQAPAGQAAKSLTDVIFCNIEKIQDALLDYLSKSLENMIGQVLDIPVCGVENFLSDMFGQINNIIDSTMGDLFSQLNNIQGGGIALPSATFSKAIKFANIITNVLDCDALNCPEPQAFNAKSGVSKAIDDSFDNIIDKMGLDRLTSFASDLEKSIPASPTAPDCSTNVLKCGPPRVDFIGSSGQGATGNAIVNALGNIIGVAINGPGFGFKEPPLLSFFDSCDKGYGAGGYPVMGPVSPVSNTSNTSAGGVGGIPLTIPNPDLIPPVLTVNAGGTGGSPLYDNDGNPIKTVGGVPVVTGGTGGIPVLSGSTGGDAVDADLSNVYVNDPNGNELGVLNVVMTSPGQEYLSNTTETNLDGDVKELIPDPNANYDGEQSYVTSLADVVVENTGFGYDDNDTASVGGGSVDVAGDTLPGDATGDTIQKPGQAQVELNIQNGLIVGANVVNGGFGFTGLPEITINSDTGAGAKLLPVLKFTKVDDASQLADTNNPFNRTLPVVTVISCIEK